MLRFARALLPFVFAITASPVEAGTITLAPVAVPVPGKAPVGLVAGTVGRNTYVAVAEYDDDHVRNYRLDPISGSLSPVGAVPIPNKPSALATAHKGKYLLATTEGGDDVTSVGIDPTSGLLTLVGSTVSSNGLDPVNVDVDPRGFAVIANKASSTLGVVRIDKHTGTLSPVGVPMPAGTGPNDVKVKSGKVVVGTAVSNEVHLFRLDRAGTLFPVDAKSVGASRVNGVTVKGNVVVAGTFAGDVHAFVMGRKGLKPIGTHPTSGDITDVAFAQNGTLFVTGGLPGRLSAFRLDKRRGLQDEGALVLPALTSRTLATVKGKKGTSFVIVNEFQGDQTVVVSARR